MQIEYALQNLFDTKVEIEFFSLSKRWGPLAFTKGGALLHSHRS